MKKEKEKDAPNEHSREEKGAAADPVFAQMTPR